LENLHETLRISQTLNNILLSMCKTAVYTLVNGGVTHKNTQQISERGDITQHDIA